ncbi:S24/S26 family peptidase (plasmid) [Citricoccus nitrophenolicus]
MPTPTTSHRRQLRPVFRLWPVLAAVLLVLAVVAGARMAGIQPWSVISGSMDPTIPKGAVVVTGSVGDPEPGQVYLYAHPGFDEPVLHRYLGPAGGGTLIFQGDANLIPDKPVHPEQLTGRMIATVPLPSGLETFIGSAATDRGGAMLTAGLTAAGIGALAGAGVLAFRRWSPTLAS